MTIEKACSQIGIPFLAMGKASGGRYYITPLDATTAFWESADFINSGIISSGTISSMVYTLLDWIEPESHILTCTVILKSHSDLTKEVEESKPTHICTCDFYTVVLRIGCQCGGN